MPQVGEKTKVPCQSCGVEMECEPLILNGVSLAPTYCDQCAEEYQQKRNEEERREFEIERKKQIEKNLEKFRRIVPPKKWELDPELFPSNIETARNCVRMVAKGKNVLIHGDSRAGKSVTAWQCCKAWIKRGGYVKVLKDVEFSRLIERSYNDKGFTHDDLIASFLEASLLFIDDLGKSKVTQRIETDLFNIIDHRTEYEYPTLITSQFVGETFMKRFDTIETGVAVNERIKEFFELVHLE